MKTSFVSNLAIQNAMRLTVQQGQAEMIKLQKEVATERYADVGVALLAVLNSVRILNRKVW